MVKYYIKLAFRNFKANKVIFGGSLLTLCLGALSISLLFSYIYNELTMNNFLTHKDDIYVVFERNSPEQFRPNEFNLNQYKSFNAKDYPEIKNLAAFELLRKEYFKLSYNNNVFTENGLHVDSTFLSIFDFPLLSGSSKTALNEPNSILLTETLAKNIFGDKNPIGKVIQVTLMEKLNVTITGILKTLPSNTAIKFDYILNAKNLGIYNSATIMLGSKNIEIDKLTDKINKTKKSSEYEQSKIKLVPLNDIYFSNGAFNTSLFSRYGDKRNLSYLTIIILVILIISALNFSTMQIISTNKASKNNAIKQVNGASFQQLARQKSVDLAITIFIASILISIGYSIILPFYNSFTQVSLNPPIWIIFLLNMFIITIVTLVGLLYPILIKRRVPIHVGLKNKIQKNKGFIGRKVIIVTQYSLTFILLISSVVVAKQLNLMLNKDLGFATENVIRTTMVEYETGSHWSVTQNKLDIIKGELKANPNIIGFTHAEPPLNTIQGDWKIAEGEQKFSKAHLLFVSSDYLKVFTNLKIIDGRFFDKDQDTIEEKIVVINEAAKKHWNITDINKVNLYSRFWSDNGRGSYKIIGVLKDFNFQHLSSSPEPLIMMNAGHLMEGAKNSSLITFKKGTRKSSLAFIEQLFIEQNPNSIFKYSFLKDEVTALYEKEKQLSIIYILFTLVALLISAIGLFTIALYDTQRRVKEIAVRKVNGATVNELLIMLNKSIVKWIVLAFIIASPIAYFVMQKWLENFAYKANISWWIFVAAGLFTLIIALITVSWRSYKAALANPVESLKSE
ncbi:FtsX-like permease family protein [Aureibaculum algae]|uniref:FtsX-like permease family protein n=1 Tax=Aureibaculum algae TaxID=2584122 RepID=A0A5B7TTL7_9FLAO|nr:ABC transporter permease [Aureibaculum algae]QCX39608.1 FtsX-like permease family protein [Aureibaculum algae]